MRGQLPAALQVLATSVRAGLSLPQALRAAGEQAPAPLGLEFARIAEEAALGATLDRALENFERRLALPEARLLVASLALARATGASLAPLLDRLVETLRERDRLRGQVRALTAQGRLSGWVVGAAPAVLLAAMALADPEYLRPLIATPAGWALLGLAALLEVLGALTIRAVVRVEA
jgi:tight adherence protein B